VLAFFQSTAVTSAPAHLAPKISKPADVRRSTAKEANAGLLLELNYIGRFLLLDLPITPPTRRKTLDGLCHALPATDRAAMAKGSEDTALYVISPAVAE